jgi:hypothetical protein
MDTDEGRLGAQLVRVVADTARLAQQIADNVLMMSVAEDYTIEGVRQMGIIDAEGIHRRLINLLDRSLALAAHTRETEAA